LKNKAIDKIVLTLVMVLLVCVAVLNICQTDRPTTSPSENRDLATMPEFSFETLFSGEYFAQLGEFLSDTFIGREKLVAFSQKLDRLKSLSLIYIRDGFSVIMNPNPTPTEDPDETLPPLPEIPTNPPTEPTDPTEPPDPEIPVILSSGSISFTAGGSGELSATVGDGYENLQWSVSDSKITVTQKNDNTVTVTGSTAGTYTVTATVTKDGENFTAQCTVTIKNVTVTPPDGGAAEFLPSGMIIYKGAVHSQSYYAGDNLASSFAALFERYTQLFPDSRMSVVNAPMSTITITDPTINKNISSQTYILDKMQSHITGNVNFVNLSDTFIEHADEYLYFKSDHHWTHRGAYYAYADFITSLGLTPTPIEEFEKRILTEKMIGSWPYYVADERVKTFYDTLEAYMPNKACTMTIYNSYGTTTTYNQCIMTNYGNYMAFLSGDHGYMVINVPENPQDKNILVIKDSYGNAFVPYLTEHYGNIVVVDPRYADLNIFDFYDDYKFEDIVFMVNIMSSNNRTWYNYLLNLLS